MAKQLTIINDENMRGIIAPSSLISKEMLEDFIDTVEMSSPESIAEDARLVEQADKDKSWIPFREVQNEFDAAR